MVDFGPAMWASCTRLLIVEDLGPILSREFRQDPVGKLAGKQQTPSGQGSERPTSEVVICSRSPMEQQSSFHAAAA